MKVKVSLKNASFYAFHGFYAEERLTGHHFLVTIDVWYSKIAAAGSDDIAGTVNYELLYDIASAEMLETRFLIETVVEAILEKTLRLSPTIMKARVRMSKLGPQLGGAVDQTQITMTKKNPK